MVSVASIIDDDLEVSDHENVEECKNLLTFIEKPKEPLFTIDLNTPNDRKPLSDYEIFYLDSEKIHTLSKPLGNVSLKNHQQTTLYYMLHLENQIYKTNTIPRNIDSQTKTLVINNDNTDTDKNTYEDTSLDSIHFTNIGLVCDKVGAGKSYCITSLISERKSLDLVSIPFRNTKIGSSEIKFEKVENKIDTNILLVPHGLVSQWEKYLKNSGLKYIVVRKAKDVYNLGINSIYAHKSFKIPDVDIGDEDTDINSVKTVKKGKKEAKKKDNESEQDSEGETDNETNNETATEKKPKAKSATKASAKVKTKNTPNAHAIPVIVEQGDATVPIKKKLSISSKNKSDVEKTTDLDKKDCDDNKDNKNPKTLSPIELEILEDERNHSELLVKLKVHKKEQKELHKKQIELDTEIYSVNTDKTKKNTLQTERTNLYNNISHLNGLISKILNEIEDYTYGIGKLTNTDIIKLQSYHKDNKKLSFKKGFQKYVTRMGNLDEEKINNTDIILVSATFYNRMALYFNIGNYTVNRIIIDECNSIKGSNLQGIKCVFTWLITSSVRSLMTDTGIIISNGPLNQWGYYPRIREKSILSTGFILDTIKQLYSNISENCKLFLMNDPTYIEQSMKLPDYLNIILICKDNLNIQVLNGIVSHDIMKMLNAGDIEGIVNKMECTVGSENNVISMVTQKYKDDLTLKEYALQVAIKRPTYDPNKETEGTKNIRIAIADLKHKIDTITERVQRIESCPICYDDITNTIITPCCSNKFCFDCITMVLNSKSICPLCKEFLTISKLLILDNGQGKLNNAKKEETQEEIAERQEQERQRIENLPYNDKLELLKKSSMEYSKYDIIDHIFQLNRNNPVQKVLIFTEYESTLNTKVTSILDKYKMKYGKIKGTGLAISKQIENYRTGETNVLMINSKYFGSGINLENTTDIIIIHKMHSDVEMQVIGRAQRYGRVGNLRVWKLYYENEMN